MWVRSEIKDVPRTTQFDLLQTVNNLVEIEHQMGAIGYEQPTSAIETLALKSVKLFKEGWDVNDDAVSN